MFPHYRPVGSAFCLGSDWVGQEFAVAWVDYCGVVVVEEVKALRQVVALLRASILAKDCSTEKVRADMVGRVD